MSNLRNVLKLIEGSHIAGDDGADRDYETARKVRNANQRKDAYDRVSDMQHFLKDYQIDVTYTRHYRVMLRNRITQKTFTFS